MIGVICFKDVLELGALNAYVFAFYSKAEVLFFCVLNVDVSSTAYMKKAYKAHRSRG